MFGQPSPAVYFAIDPPDEGDDFDDEDSDEDEDEDDLDEEDEETYLLRSD